MPLYMCHPSSVIHHVLSAICHPSSVVSCTSSVIPRLSSIVHRLPTVINNPSTVVHLSSVIRHPALFRHWQGVPTDWKWWPFVTDNFSSIKGSSNWPFRWLDLPRYSKVFDKVFLVFWAMIIMIFNKTWCQILGTMRLQCVSKILTPRRMLQKTWLMA